MWIAAVNGSFAKAIKEGLNDLLPYLMKYGTQPISELLACPLSDLRDYADGISRILEAENG